MTRSLNLLLSSLRKVIVLQLLRRVGGFSGPPCEIYCSNPAAQQLKALIPTELFAKAFVFNVVKADDCLDLGGGQSPSLPQQGPEWRKAFSTWMAKAFPFVRLFTAALSLCISVT